MFTKDTTPVKTETLLLYFSAHWCPPCRLLTPLLAQFYEGLRAEGITGDKCEVVFVSSDRSEEQFKEYYATMPWGHLRFSEREEKNRLSSLYGLSSIPRIIVLDRKGVPVASDARGLITAWANIAPEKRRSAASLLAEILAPC